MVNKDILNHSFWALPVGKALDVLETTAMGLSQEDAQRRSYIFGKNVLPTKTKITKLRIFFRQFKSPLILLLIVAGVITLFLRHFNDAAFILGAALVNSFLGFYQENKAEEALIHLKTYIKERVRVFRDNHEIEIDAAELVPGDMIHLSQGGRVPADCRIIYANDLSVDQSILTGESLPVLKKEAAISFKAVLADQQSMVFSGTAVVQGFANAVVTAIGVNTEIGKIAELVRGPEREKTPLQAAMARFSVKVGLILIIMTAVIFAMGILGGQSKFDMFLIAVAIAVAAIPEGLPIALTVILAMGVQRLAYKKGIVRKLLAAETLGSTSVILTDKTGTLTQAKMELSKISIFDNLVKNTTEDLILQLVILNGDVVIENLSDHEERWKIIGRPLEVAAVKAAAKKGVLLPLLKKKMPVAEYLPFNSVNKFSAAIIHHDSGYLLSMFGAPEILLKYSDISKEEHGHILREVNKMASSGERVLAVAAKEISEPIPLNDKKIFNGVKFLGSVSFRDPVRPEIKEVINRVAEAGINTVIVTGDHRGTAEAVAKEVGLKFTKSGVIDGAELDALSADDLRVLLPGIKIISRVSPEGKLRIVKAFQETGAVVAMTGDGVNDAPSLKRADIGIGMGSGSDVAKDVADLILLDNNFETIVKAINEGRRIIANIKKVIVYMLSSALDEIILIGGALIAGLALPINPLQILWVNFFTDSFPGIALAFEDGIDRLKLKPPKLHKNLLDSEMKFLILVIGILSSLLLFALYWGLLRLGFNEAVVKTFIFAAFGTYTLLLIFSVRSLKHNLFTINPFSNIYLLLSVICGLILMWVAIYVPFFQKLFETVALPYEWLWGVFGVSVLNILLIEFGKWIFRKH